MKLLFITATRIGDAVLSTGLLGWLIDRYPGARVTVACGRHAAPIFAALPGLERLVIVDKRPGHAHWLSLWAGAASRRWNMVVDLRGSAIAYFLLAGERRIIGKRDDSRHRVRELAQLFDLDPPPSPRVWIGADERALAQALVPGGRAFLAVGPTANWPGKTWRAERFAELARRLTATGARLANARIVVLGAANERAQADAMIAGLAGRDVVDLVGKASLPEAAALLERAALYVGNDSGLMHLAAATAAPTLGLFGPSDERRYAPWGARAAFVRTPESMRQLISRPGYDHRTVGTLMDSLSVDAVVEAADRLLSRGADRAA